MSIFNKLPTVKKCCCCIPLKVGCYIIGILGMIAPLNILYINMYYDVEIKGVTYTSFVVDILVFLWGLLLIVALCQNNERLLRIWLYIALVILLLHIIACVFVFALFAMRDASEYDERKLCVDTAILYVIDIFFLLYFMIVVNSYRRTRMLTPA